MALKRKKISLRKVGGQPLGPNQIRRHKSVIWMKLKGGLETCLDKKGYRLVSMYRWYAIRGRHTWYVRADYSLPNGRRLRLSMHRLIVGQRTSKQIDHEDKNGLNNRRSNLRKATPSQNQANRGKKAGTTKNYKGVYNTKRRLAKPWMAYLAINYKLKNLGYYSTEREAAIAYNNAAKKYFGDFARLNDLSKISLKPKK